MVKTKDIKNYISDLRKYIKVLSDFENLNQYIYNSSIFLNRLELVLYNDELSNEQKINNIILSYSEFKVSNLDTNFDNGVEVDNAFED